LNYRFFVENPEQKKDIQRVFVFPAVVPYKFRVSISPILKRILFIYKTEDKFNVQ
jgi:hypothetical protein